MNFTHSFTSELSRIVKQLIRFNSFSFVLTFPAIEYQRRKLLNVLVQILVRENKVRNL